MNSPQRVIPSCAMYQCHLLREDQELAEAIPTTRRAEAIEECTARELRIPAGRRRYNRPRVATAEFALLVLQGLIVARHRVAGREAAELLGEGDVLDLHRERNQASLLAVEVGWSVLEPVRIALLDHQFLQQHVVRHPELIAAVFTRSAQRSRNLAVSLAIAHQPRIDVRIRMLLWHLAGRWGRVRPDGVVLPKRLTHSLLADLIAAQRPTVSTALAGLADDGLVRKTADGWLLRHSCITHEILPAVVHTENGFSNRHAGLDRR